MEPVWITRSVSVHLYVMTLYQIVANIACPCMMIFTTCKVGNLSLCVRGVKTKITRFVLFRNLSSISVNYFLAMCTGVNFEVQEIIGDDGRRVFFDSQNNVATIGKGTFTFPAPDTDVSPTVTVYTDVSHAHAHPYTHTHTHTHTHTQSTAITLPLPPHTHTARYIGFQPVQVQYLACSH